MKKVISYSLWGDSDIYYEGLIQNCIIAKNLLPDYLVWVYVDETHNRQRLNDIFLKQSNVKIKEDKLCNFFYGMFWRMFAMESENVVLCRDLDSRLSIRECNLIREWECSPFNFHTIRDHPCHTMPIMGGLWGCKNNKFNNIKQILLKNNVNELNGYGSDQEFLKDTIFPMIKDDCIEYSSNGIFFTDHIIKIQRPPNGEFIGERIDYDGNPLYASDRFSTK